MSDGFVIIHRSILDTPIYQNPALFHLFVHCILRANYKERRVYIGGKIVDLKPGQFLTGRERFAKEVGCPPSTVRYRLMLLQDMNYITIFSTASYSIITVNNYNLYQNKKNIGQPVDSRLTAVGQPFDTDNKENKETKKQEEEYRSSNEALVDGKPPTRPRVSYVSFLETYNKIAGSTFGGRKSLSPELKKSVKNLIEFLGENNITVEDYFKMAVNNHFLKYGGSGKPGWRATFSFLVNVTKADKLISGEYDSFKKRVGDERKKKTLPESEKNARIAKYEALLSEDRENAERFRQSTINTKGYDPKLDKEV